MPDIDDINQYRREVSRRRARERLEKLFEGASRSQPDTIPLGKARYLLAPEDTTAYPPEVLSREVLNVHDIDRLGYKGLYRLTDPDKLGITGFHSNISEYDALLHELAHARGHDFIRRTPTANSALSKFLSDSTKNEDISSDDILMMQIAKSIGPLSENYAQALTDSILKTKRRQIPPMRRHLLEK